MADQKQVVEKLAGCHSQAKVELCQLTARFVEAKRDEVVGQTASPVPAGAFAPANAGELQHYGGQLFNCVPAELRGRSDLQEDVESIRRAEAAMQRLRAEAAKAGLATGSEGVAPGGADLEMEFDEDEGQMFEDLLVEAVASARVQGAADGDEDGLKEFGDGLKEFKRRFREQATGIVRKRLKSKPRTGSV